MTFRVCMVCLGNICRSPIAASVLRSKLEAAGLGGDVVVESAGTGSWHVGDGADHRARATLRAAGYDDEHSARQFVTRYYEDYDLVIAMDANNLRDLRRIAPEAEIGDRVRMLRSYDPTAKGDLDMPDPYYGGDDGFQLVLAQVERACDGLVAELRDKLNG
ncbi:low molecular weight protein-tyrosine-phosphatase [Sporichthya sp.]|uniref:low molecular weight protein-tyrosine-phosphatase n=1 Tax=Sporichthya sp. TaxID=65475 RepID=UPI0018377834|nr:low molecular weight protein-tyrosine-phosphatase [Sporichthya sp.]MBA3745166.1 low molecular weight phosphotyrosine protein phosphatase [Sporichthya sp.]